MKEIKYDLLIVGGGPAGSTAAACAIDRGFKTCIIDKEQFPRDKVCGDFILAPALTVLNRYNIDITSMVKKYLSSYGVTFIINGEKYVHKQAELFGITAQRKLFDAELLTGVAPFIDTFLEYSILSIELINNGYEIVISNKSGEKKKLWTKYIVGADGSSSFIRRSFFKDYSLENGIATREYCDINVDTQGFCFYYFPEIEFGGYFWVFPLNDKEVNCGVVLYTDHWKEHFTNIYAVHQYYKKKILQEPADKKNIKTWSLPLNLQKQQSCIGNILLVGDAAGLIHPFFGHGIDTAIYSAEIAVKHIAIHMSDNNYAIQDEYSAEINKKFTEPNILFKQFRDTLMKADGKLLGKLQHLYNS